MDATRLILHHQEKKLLYNIKLSKRVTKIHLVSQKAIRKMTKQPRYQINHVTVMYECTVANISIYFVKSNTETLLSGNVCEELGIITFRPQPSTIVSSVQIWSFHAKTYKEQLIVD